MYNAGYIYLWKVSRGRRSADIISMLVNIYGSKKIFVNEYRLVLTLNSWYISLIKSIVCYININYTVYTVYPVEFVNIFEVPELDSYFALFRFELIDHYFPTISYIFSICQKPRLNSVPNFRVLFSIGYSILWRSDPYNFKGKDQHFFPYGSVTLDGHIT